MDFLMIIQRIFYNQVAQYIFTINEPNISAVKSNIKVNINQNRSWNYEIRWRMSKDITDITPKIR